MVHYPLPTYLKSSEVCPVITLKRREGENTVRLEYDTLTGRLHVHT